MRKNDPITSATPDRVRLAGLVGVWSGAALGFPTLHGPGSYGARRLAALMGSLLKMTVTMRLCGYAARGHGDDGMAAGWRVVGLRAPWSATDRRCGYRTRDLSPDGPFAGQVTLVLAARSGCGSCSRCRWTAVADRSSPAPTSSRRLRTSSIMRVSSLCRSGVTPLRISAAHRPMIVFAN